LEQIYRYRITFKIPISRPCPLEQNSGDATGCVEALQYWFWYNGLLPNPSKSAIVYFGTHGRLRQSILPLQSQILAAGCTVNVSDRLFLLAIRPTLDNTLSFDQHVINIVKNCDYHLQVLRHIRASVTDEVAKMTARCIIGSQTDYCNSLFYGMTDMNLNKLQRVQNRTARIVCGTGSQHISSAPQLHHLHWLPVHSRI